MSLIRKYTDVHGNAKTLKHVRRLDGYVGYRKEDNLSYPQAQIVYSPASIWEMEDGYQIQIPEDVWEFMGIEYEDAVVLEKK